MRHLSAKVSLPMRSNSLLFLILDGVQCAPSYTRTVTHCPRSKFATGDGLFIILVPTEVRVRVLNLDVGGPSNQPDLAGQLQ
jgi:hypothetical protein